MFAWLHRFGTTGLLTLLLLVPGIGATQQVPAKMCEVRPGCVVFLRQCDADTQWQGQCANGYAEGKGFIRQRGYLSLTQMSQGRPADGVAIARFAERGNQAMVSRKTAESVEAAVCDTTGFPTDGSEKGLRLCADGMKAWGKTAVSANFPANEDQIIKEAMNIAGIQAAPQQPSVRLADDPKVLGRGARPRQ